MSTVVHRDTVTVGEAFLAMVETRADAPAILNADLEVVLSWRDYGTQARRAATGLAALGLGLGQGDTLGLLLSNRPEFHVADAGALLLGATLDVQHLGARTAHPLGRRRRLPNRHHRGDVG